MEGIGEATALALALTESLGGRRHDSLASLRAWAQTGVHSAQLEAYLLYRRDTIRMHRHLLIPPLTSHMDFVRDCAALLPTPEAHRMVNFFCGLTC